MRSVNLILRKMYLSKRKKKEKIHEAKRPFYAIFNYVKKPSVLIHIQMKEQTV